MDRRKFVTAAGLAGAAGLVSACSKQNSADCADVSASTDLQPIEWKMVTAWPRDFPGLGTGANYLAQIIEEMSNSRLRIKIYGGGELVPPLEVFDAVQRGTAEMGHGGAYSGKARSLQPSSFPALRSV